MFTLAAVFVQYVIASVVIFHVPLKITGWKKGLAVSIFCSLPLAIIIPHYDPAASLISGFIILCSLGCLVGAYASRENEQFPLDRVIRAIAAGIVTGAIHITIMFLKDVSIYSMSAVYLQYITACLLIFFAPVKLTGWSKGVVVAVFASMPLVILVPHYDPSGSTISGFILVATLGSLVGIYSSYKEEKV